MHKYGERGHFTLSFLNLEHKITSHHKTYVPEEMGVKVVGFFFFSY